MMTTNVMVSNLSISFYIQVQHLIAQIEFPGNSLFLMVNFEFITIHFLRQQKLQVNEYGETHFNGVVQLYPIYSFFMYTLNMSSLIDFFSFLGFKFVSL